MVTASAPLPAVVRPAALVAVVASVVDLTFLAAFHVLQPDVDPLTTATSSYVHGTAGQASQVATLAAGVGALSLAVALRTVGRGSRWMVGLALLVVFGLAKVVHALFPIAPDGASTGTGAVHNLTGNLAFFVLPVAAVLLGSLVARATGRRVVGVLGGVVAATTVGVLAGDAVGAFGLAQRVYLVSAAAWVATCAWAVLAPGRTPTRGG
ncbi:DUF998 domain-containing protein [Ornithinicoccus hortensis]|uniref:Uncharacterized protein DUF998 n=1 Tax=Ornithinicoccus hortensis TaxID=82346 RepID=A0A542YUL0_9MICO|nr:DUF998 domain-containing protein [Ornithinicoccus hortensis]TQL51767.1 uncharacterized protein DUF998 [Ornithinicoccus hortensis]